ncbi:apolipoprotein acyltransferase [Glutamicibacter uratoxydans]|uniref:Apolipoprotein acyltransferase n=1 Tax=Glutamicibacter uratoxydans TaxID=43667 RepID=A0A4Y4DLM1_GLUUR|nr:carbon-nitrogen hydrolase family protein [Glutamicibacter uratoxydans]GED05503.1 apolipoprotein acyltransferase [Glutamicibacter uratoxydans]
MKIALAQILSTADIQTNLELVKSHSIDAAAQGARLIVFPEATMRSFGNELQSVAQEHSVDWANAVRSIAAEHNITIVVGMFTPGEGERVRNTLLITGPCVDKSYDKIHLYDAYGYQESVSVTPGDKTVTFAIDGVTFGVATCYDVRFPEIFFANAANGAVVNIVCASWAMGPGKVEQWQLATRARAMDSTTYVVAVDQADPHTVSGALVTNDPLGVGHSSFIAPNGTILEDLGEAPVLRIVEVDPQEVERVRAGLPVLANARLRSKS